MLLRSIFVSLLFFTSHASSLSKILDSDMDPPVPSGAQTAIGPKAQLIISNDFVSPDGYNRSAVVVNGQLPAPLIWANKSDDFAIEVFNNLTDSSMPLQTSVHFHGLFQRKSNWADGVAYVTQCPLRPNESFVQTFNAMDQTGTYWYHSHYSTQYCDGLRGPLVIYDPNDPLKYLYDVDDENTVITLSDWYHTPSLSLSHRHGLYANATLINGKGRYPGGPPSNLSVITVEEGLRYRFRIVSASCDPSFNFSIDSHRMTIIEVDGTEIHPVEVDSIPVFAGQRYSVVVTANQTAGNYWIRAFRNQDNSTYDNYQNMAILRYDNANDSYPKTNPGPYELSFDEGSLHPLCGPVPGPPEIGKADYSLILAPGFNDDSKKFTFNNVSYSNTTIPVLLQILSGARQASSFLPSGSVYNLTRNQVVEISFPNSGVYESGPHPIHLHGHNFYVVRVAGSNDTNFVDPVRRDVVSLGTNSWDNVTIRFVTDNPGPWFLHCHIDWHLNNGFAAVMAEAPNATAYEELPVIPTEWYDLCREDYDWGQTRWGQTRLGLPTN